ncbi:porin [Ramlibacter sp. AW1]|uniref:Porin n=1 Tax=Ramlibacter aurantiacus TaxID=2801330 RepID=A0A937D363_9BURK|nr:porin [Ramlibacter aurantiacus]MBL0418987.1 porin [Ramlibacter aurantiacus]
MRRTPPLLALGAIAACSTAALAAEPSPTSSVKLYGSLDLGVLDSNRGRPQIGTIQRSYVGIRGEEQLGAGMAATFHLQSRWELDSGTREASGAQPAFYGESTVGLKGGFGAIRLGRALSPLWAQDWAFDPWSNFNRVSSPAWQVFHPSYRTQPHHNGPIGDYSRLNNGIFYDSPAVGGFTLHVAAGLEKRETPDANGLVDTRRNIGASINYAAGPWAAMLAGERNSADDNTGFAGLAYEFGATRLMGSYNHTGLSATSQAFLGDTSRTRRAVTMGVTHVIGAHTLRLGWGRDFEGYGTAGATHHAGFGVSHALSKRTSLYADLGASYPDAGDRTTRWGLGVNHSF